MKQEVTKQEILNAINTWATRIESRMATKDDIQELRKELRQEIRVSEHRIRDHVDAKLSDVSLNVRSNKQRIETLESLHSL